ncbi:MAG: hypothetical protein KAT14_06135, partial [Candidatus Marinimicrobia bacterium]|nr:hypothetical protein [Candidatus Neomarinimicrobiota bacterium]
MKKIIMLGFIVLLLSGCSTYYGKYDYNKYFQNKEPFITVDNEQEAAKFIARKLARRFKRSGPRTVVVLNFTDEYGDSLKQGAFFAGMIISGLDRYRNPIVVERDALYEIVKERELTQTNLISNKGYELKKLIQAEYILNGRILCGKRDDMISVRCFEVGTGKVVYASTISIDRTPEVQVPPAPPIIIITDPHRPGPHYPKPPRPPSPEPPSTPKPPTPDPDDETDKKPSPPSDGIENIGKKDLDKAKPSTSNQIKYKKKPEDKVTKKPSSTNL